MISAPEGVWQGAGEDRSGVYIDVNEHRTAARNAARGAPARCIDPVNGYGDFLGFQTEGSA